MVMVMVDGLLLGVHNANTPTDAEWAEYLANSDAQLCRQAKERVPCRQLIVTDGGGPNLEQRRAAHRMTAGRRGRVAVVSESGFVRFAVKALTITNPDIRVYSSARMDEALAYLGMGDASRVAEQVEGLRRKLTTPSRSGSPKKRKARGDVPVE